MSTIPQYNTDNSNYNLFLTGVRLYALKRFSHFTFKSSSAGRMNFGWVTTSPHFSHPAHLFSKLLLASSRSSEQLLSIDNSSTKCRNRIIRAIHSLRNLVSISRLNF
mmetsp:Transcript_6593/g.9850  ORF Transcript_6593/g.9850 Transcript_6593/m.9850 type:complete len:107 (-) Transcript_6593:672-992(-)